MRLVVDANVLFAALMRDGLTRLLFFDDKLDLLAPAYLKEELDAHRAELLRKSGLSAQDFETVERDLLEEVEIVPAERFKRLLYFAEGLTRDDDDLLYLACALAVDAGIWTHDKGFDEQQRVKIWKTAELARELGLLP